MIVRNHAYILGNFRVKKMVTIHDFIQLLDNSHRMFRKVNDIDIAKTAVLCLSCDAEAAAAYYQKKYGSKPDIYLLDGEEGRGKKLAQHTKEYLDKYKLLYVAPHAQPWQEFTRGCQLMQKIGIFTFDINSDFDQNFPWINSAHIKNDWFLQQLEKVSLLYNALADDESKKVFLGALKARLVQDMGYYALSTFPCYHHPKVKIKPGDVVIDAGIGGYIQPTIDFSNIVGTNGKVIGFELDPKYYENAKNNLGQYNNITLHNIGLWKESGEVKFYSSPYDDSRIQENNPNIQTAAKVTDLDSWLEEHHLSCDFIKMDIEGAELSALQGAVQTLAKFRPNLSICLYHHPTTQLVTIFDFLYTLDLGYSFYMAQHLPYICDTVLYATARHEQL